MYPLLMEELARDRGRALLKEAADRRLAARASARRRVGQMSRVGVLRRATGRALISVGSRLAGAARTGVQ